MNSAKRNQTTRRERPTRPNWAHVLWPLVAGLLAAGAASAQDAAGEPRPPSDTTFVDRVDVDIVNVEVYVTDKKGQPIRGLSREDFRLTEDGEEKPITNFYAAEGVRPSAPAPPDTTSSETASAETTAAETTAPDQQLHLVVFVDNRSLRPAHRNRVLEAARDTLLDPLKPTDRVTLVDYDGSVEVHTLPSTDRDEIEAGLERLIQGSSYGQMAAMERASVLRQLSQIGTSGFAAGIPDLRDEIEILAQREFDEVRATAQALSQFVGVLAALEGRKALIYLSDGLSIHPGEVLFQALGRFEGGERETNLEARQYDTSEYFEAVGKQANSARVTFYTILAGGPHSPTITPAEIPAFVDTGDTVNLGRVWDSTFETIEHSNNRANLEVLAASTGGRSTTSTLNFDDAIEDLRKDFDSYYSLGFRAAEDGGDPQDHRIEIEVSDPSWRVRHRETYRRQTADQKMASVTRSALLLRQAENPLGVTVEFADPQKHERRQWLVPILVKFPISQLTLIPGESRHQGQVTIYVGSQGPDGDQSPVQKLPAPIQIPDGQLEGALEQQAGYRMALLMRPGEHRVAVTVRDELAGITSATVLAYSPTSPR